MAASNKKRELFNVQVGDVFVSRYYSDRDAEMSKGECVVKRRLEVTAILMMPPGVSVERAPDYRMRNMRTGLITILKHDNLRARYDRTGTGTGQALSDGDAQAKRDAAEDAAISQAVTKTLGADVLELSAPVSPAPALSLLDFLRLDFASVLCALAQLKQRQEACASVQILEAQFAAHIAAHSEWGDSVRALMALGDRIASKATALEIRLEDLGARVTALERRTAEQPCTLPAQSVSPNALVALENRLETKFELLRSSVVKLAARAGGMHV